MRPFDVHFQSSEYSVHGTTGNKDHQGRKRCAAPIWRSADVSGFSGLTEDGNEGNVHLSGPCCSMNSVEKLVVSDGFGDEGSAHHSGPG